MSARKRLKKARKQRHKIAHQFRLLDAGAVSLEDYLREPGELARVDVWDVLRRAPKMGRDGSKKVLTHAKVWPHTRLGDLTNDERSRIIAALPQRARNVPGRQVSRARRDDHAHESSRSSARFTSS